MATVDLLPHPITAQDRVTLVLKKPTPLASVISEFLPYEDQSIFAMVNGQIVEQERWGEVILTEGDVVQCRVTMHRGGSNPIGVLIGIGILLAAGPIAIGLAANGVIAASSIGTVFGSVLGIGAMVIVSSLLAPRLPDLGDGRGDLEQQFSLTGGSNQARPYESLMLVLGRHRIFPDLLAREYTEFAGTATRRQTIADANIPDLDNADPAVIAALAEAAIQDFGHEIGGGVSSYYTDGGDVRYNDQILYSLFDCGIGDLDLSQERFGETLMSDFEDVSTDTSAPIDLVAGNVDTIEGATLEPNVAVTRRTAAGTNRVVFSLISQRFSYNDDGDVVGGTNQFRLEYRLVGTTAWTANVVSMATPSSAQARNASRRSFGYDLPAAGQYDVRVTLLTDIDDMDETLTANAVLFSINAHQPTTAPLSGRNPYGIKVRATGQLSGRLQRFSLLARQRIPSWDGTDWVARQFTSNPADLLRAWWLGFRRPSDNKLMAGRAYPTARIDHDALARWHDFCRINGLECDLVLTGRESDKDIETMIMQCGWASETKATGKFGVVWENDDEPVTAVFTPDNIVAGSVEVVYENEGLADEIVGRFYDRDSDYKENTIRRTVPGTSNPERPVHIQLKGITSGTHAAKELNRIAAEQFYHNRIISWRVGTEGRRPFVSKGAVVGLAHGLVGGSLGGRIRSIDTARTEIRTTIPDPPAAGTAWIKLLTGAIHSSAFTSAGDVLTLTDAIPAAPDGVTEDPLAYHVMTYDATADPVKVRVVGIDHVGEGIFKITARDEIAQYYDARVSDLTYQLLPDRTRRRPIPPDFSELIEAATIGEQRWLFGTGAPAASLGNDGYLYLDQADSVLYQKVNGAWVLRANLSRADTAQWHVIAGPDDPGDDLGMDGDFLFRTSDATIWAKAAGSWAVLFDIDGAQSAIWHAGGGEPAADLGRPGHFYFRTDNGFVYRKVDETTWSFLRDITGPGGLAFETLYARVTEDQLPLDPLQYPRNSWRYGQPGDATGGSPQVTATFDDAAFRAVGSADRGFISLSYFNNQPAFPSAFSSDGSTRQFSELTLRSSGQVNLGLVGTRADLSDAFVNNGTIQVISGSLSLTFMIAGADMTEPYTFRPSNVDEVVRFVRDVFAQSNPSPSVIFTIPAVPSTVDPITWHTPQNIPDLHADVPIRLKILRPITGTPEVGDEIDGDWITPPVIDTQLGADGEPGEGGAGTEDLFARTARDVTAIPANQLPLDTWRYGLPIPGAAGGTADRNGLTWHNRRLPISDEVPKRWIISRPVAGTPEVGDEIEGIWGSPEIDAELPDVDDSLKFWSIGVRYRAGQSVFVTHTVAGFNIQAPELGIDIQRPETTEVVVYTALVDHLSSNANGPPNRAYWRDGVGDVPPANVPVTTPSGPVTALDVVYMYDRTIQSSPPGTPTGGQNEEGYTPAGWTRVKTSWSAAGNEFGGVVEVRRVKTYQGGVFQSATAWGSRTVVLLGDVESARRTINGTGTQTAYIRGTEAPARPSSRTAGQSVPPPGWNNQLLDPTETENVYRTTRSATIRGSQTPANTVQTFGAWTDPVLVSEAGAFTHTPGGDDSGGGGGGGLGTGTTTRPDAIYRKASSTPARPAGGTDDEDHLPAGGWVRSPIPAADAANAVYRCDRTLTYHNGVFRSATAWSVVHVQAPSLSGETTSPQNIYILASAAPAPPANAPNTLRPSLTGGWSYNKPAASTMTQDIWVATRTLTYQGTNFQSASNWANIRVDTARIPTTPVTVPTLGVTLRRVVSDTDLTPFNSLAATEGDLVAFQAIKTGDFLGAFEYVWSVTGDRSKSIVAFHARQVPTEGGTQPVSVQLRATDGTVDADGATLASDEARLVLNISDTPAPTLAVNITARLLRLGADPLNPDQGLQLIDQGALGLPGSPTARVGDVIRAIAVVSGTATGPITHSWNEGGSGNSIEFTIPAGYAGSLSRPLQVDVTRGGLSATDRITYAVESI